MEDRKGHVDTPGPGHRPGRRSSPQTHKGDEVGATIKDRDTEWRGLICLGSLGLLFVLDTGNERTEDLPCHPRRGRPSSRRPKWPTVSLDERPWRTRRHRSRTRLPPHAVGTHRRLPDRRRLGTPRFDSLGPPSYSHDRVSRPAWVSSAVCRLDGRRPFLPTSTHY